MEWLNTLPQSQNGQAGLPHPCFRSGGPGGLVQHASQGAECDAPVAQATGLHSPVARRSTGPSVSASQGLSPCCLGALAGAGDEVENFS